MGLKNKDQKSPHIKIKLIIKGTKSDKITPCPKAIRVFFLEVLFEINPSKTSIAVAPAVEMAARWLIFARKGKRMIERSSLKTLDKKDTVPNRGEYSWLIMIPES
jgi:hypothetical protein